MATDQVAASKPCARGANGPGTVRRVRERRHERRRAQLDRQRHVRDGGEGGTKRQRAVAGQQSTVQRFVAQCVAPRSWRLGRCVGDLQVRQQARRHGVELVRRAARARQVQRVDEHGAVWLIGFGHHGDGLGERRDGEDRQELEDDDDASGGGPLAQLAEALHHRRTVRWTTRHQHVADAELGRRVHHRIAGIVAASEDHRLDVERGDPGRRQATGDGDGRRRCPRRRIEPQAGGVESRGGGGVDGAHRIEVEHGPGRQRDEPPVRHQAPTVSQNGRRSSLLLILPIAVRPTVGTMSTERGHL